MYSYPIFEVEEMSDELVFALEQCADAVLGTTGILDDQDYVEWPLEMGTTHKRAISDESYENYRVVTDFILDELDVAGFEDLEYVIIRT